MRKTSYVSLSRILLPILLLTFTAGGLRAQTLFQNNNVACESEDVLCDTVAPGVNCLGNDATSVSCKNVTASTDFNGDGFVDCAAASSFFNNFNQPPSDFSTVNVLMNRAGSAVDCASGTGNQFNPAQNETINYGSNSTGITTIVTGQINGDAFSDLAVATDQIQALAPLADVISAFSPGAAGYPADSDITSSKAAWFANGNQFGFDSDSDDRTLALIDCNNDSDLDAVMVVADQTDPNSLRLNVLLNNGSGLQAILPGDSFDTGLTISEPSPTLAVADFNNDGFDDIVFSLADFGSGDIAEVGVCLNDGSCGFSNCPASFRVNVDSLHAPTESPFPVSIAAADFNGDGNADAAFSEDGLNGLSPGGFDGVHYLFGDGSSSFTSNVHVDFQPERDSDPQTVTTGCFNNDNVVDLALTTFVNINSGIPSGSTSDSFVGVITSSPGGNLNAPLSLAFSTTNQVGNAEGIDAADFDNAGGDDIIALALRLVPNQGFTRQAFVFMNTLEDILAEAGPDLTVDVGEPVTLSGASCAVNPDNPSDPASFDVQWAVSPPVGSVLSGGDTLTPTFTGNTAGTYTLTLTCTTRCDDTATDTLTITVVGTPPAPFDTQGGCIRNSLIPGGGEGMKNMWLLFGLLPLAFFAFRFRGYKKSGVAVLLLGSMLAGHSAQALTKSFSVNTFEPTIDDSEYFTIYSSPTMLKRNYHVGFYLDYARNTYEFGTPNFNRTGGIVEDLLTGNISGSYAIFDWFTAGLLIPVYFWEGLQSNNPALLVNENNFDLGDVQLVLKFRLLDRERRHVGISVVPFMSFPTSTGSSDFLGQGSFNGGGKVVIDGRIKDRVSLALNVGYITRSNVTDIAGNQLDDQFFGGLGISVDILKNKLLFIGEATVYTVAKDFFESRRTTPAEARGGFRYTFAHNHDINAGAGFGLTNGIGSPSWRAFVGYTYTKRPIADVAAPQPPISEVNVGDELTLQDKIYFEFDKAVIRDISKPTLDKIAGFLKAHPEVTKIKIDGNTCDLGTDAYNMRLSQKRAKAAADYLIGQGIDPSRIGTVEGFGERKPLVPNTDEQAREQNRRVQIFVESVNK